MEEPKAYAMPGGHIAQRPLRPVDGPLRGGDSGLLVGIRIAQHHLLNVAPGADDRPVRGHREQLVEQGPTGVQLGDRLQQRHEPDPGARGVRVDQPRLAGQHHRGEHVVDAERHRDDVRLDHLGAEPVLRLADRAEHVERAAGGLRQRGVYTGQRAPPVQLAGEQCGALGPRQPAVRRHLAHQRV
jgi:hypothetical protein